MIHIAPCSCELHQALREALERNRRDVIRIRELEAELDGHQDDVGGSVRQCQVRIVNAEKWLRECQAKLAGAEARAEKAEAENAWMIRTFKWNPRALEECQARVAELEKERHELRLAVFDTETLRVKEREAD